MSSQRCLGYYSAAPAPSRNTQEENHGNGSNSSASIRLFMRKLVGDLTTETETTKVARTNSLCPTGAGHLRCVLTAHPCLS